MYSMKVKPSDENKVVIDRRMSSNNAVDLIPVAIEICKAEYNMVNPIALYMGCCVWRIFDPANPHRYAKVYISTDCN